MPICVSNRTSSRHFASMSAGSEVAEGGLRCQRQTGRNQANISPESTNTSRAAFLQCPKILLSIHWHIHRASGHHAYQTTYRPSSVLLPYLRIRLCSRNLSQATTLVPMSLPSRLVLRPVKYSATTSAYSRAK